MKSNEQNAIDKTIAVNRRHFLKSTGVITATSAWSTQFTGVQAQTPSLTAPQVDSAPSLNGAINTDEWSAANQQTLTFRNYNGTRQQDTPVYLARTDTDLLIAINSQFRDGWDSHTMLYIDGNHNGRLDGQTSQPYTDVRVAAPAPSAWDGYNRFQALGTQSQQVLPSSAQRTSSVQNGAVQYEFAVPFDALDISPGDTIGIRLRTHTPNHGKNERFFWPIRPPESSDPGDWASLSLEGVSQMPTPDNSNQETDENGFSGVAKTPFGERLGGVKVALYESTKPATADGNPVATATTNAGGRFKITESVPENPVIIAVHPQRNLFHAMGGFEDLASGYTIRMNYHLLFGPTVTNSGLAAVSVWRRIFPVDPQYQILFTEVITAPYEDRLLKCGVGMSVPEDIDVKYAENTVTNHPYPEPARINSHITDDSSSSKTLDKYPPQVTGVPVFPVVGFNEEAYRYEPERRQDRRTLNQAAMDVFSATPILGTALGAISAIGTYFGKDTNKGTVAAGSRPESLNKNQSDSVSDLFTVQTEALVFQVPVKVTELTGQVQFEASWTQGELSDTQVFGHQQDLAFMQV